MGCRTWIGHSCCRRPGIHERRCSAQELWTQVGFTFWSCRALWYVVSGSSPRLSFLLRKWRWVTSVSAFWDRGSYCGSRNRSLNGSLCLSCWKCVLARTEAQLQRAWEKGSMCEPACCTGRRGENDVSLGTWEVSKGKVSSKLTCVGQEGNDWGGIIETRALLRRV